MIEPLVLSAGLTINDRNTRFEGNEMSQASGVSMMGEPGSPGKGLSSDPIAMERIKTERPFTSLLRPNTSRPGSALARGVQITEFEDPRINPEPMLMEETDLLLEEYLSPRKLRALTGVEDLDEVHFLEMKVDTTDTSLGNFGAMLPNLSQLKLSNSNITSVRDLGSSLTSLKVLWMARCCLENIDGIFSMTNLRELYLAYNEISDISPCSMLENVQIIDLEGNNIEDICQVEFLALCSSLSNLTLEGNPICVTPKPDVTSEEYDYRVAVKKSVPHLTLLDDEPLEEVTSQHRKDASVFDADWKLLEELMQDGSVPLGSSDSVDQVAVPARPVTSLRPTSGYRPGSVLRPTSAMRRPGTGMRPTTARPTSTDSVQSTGDDASDLTKGSVVCGPPSKALRTRTNPTKVLPPKDTDKPKLYPQSLFQHKAEHTYDEPLDEETADDILSELKAWKLENLQRKEKIESERAPQVLKIDYDDAVSLSDEDQDEEILSDNENEPITEQNDLASSRTSQESGFSSSMDTQPLRQTSTSLHDMTPSRISTESGVDMTEYRSDVPASLLHQSPQHSPLHSSPQHSPHAPTPPGTKPKHISSRRMRVKSIEKEKDIKMLRKSRMQSDESFEIEENDLSGSKSQSDSNLRGGGLDLNQGPAQFDDQGRPISGPAAFARNSKFRFDSAEKTHNKVIDKSRPVIRTLINSPERSGLDPTMRHNTARAAVKLAPIPPIGGSRMRRQLPQVATLPSRHIVPK
ncbi:unnamed protein product [Owenia fusiformis]|uniref:Uncharacterized protein n=1 Tax=Owenia fusiformis TaxID=6347 RepID=A0A8J1TYT0_OWEFU|nr:unnamed protein product [Owenia fusiformis]